MMQMGRRSSSTMYQIDLHDLLTVTKARYERRCNLLSFPTFDSLSCVCQ